MYKVLNLYAGIGGNRKLWENVEVTAVENNPEVVAIYQDLYPNDKVIIGDAHQYLSEHFREFDFIWASPPCPSHSCIRKMGTNPSKNFPNGQNKPLFPDMTLYEEIIFLQHYFKGLWVVENVMPYYEPLIKGKKIGRHLFWSNFPLNKKQFKPKMKINTSRRKDHIKTTGIDLSKYQINHRLDQIYRNCVDSQLGNYIFESAFKVKQEVLFG